MAEFLLDSNAKKQIIISSHHVAPTAGFRDVTMEALAIRAHCFLFSETYIHTQKCGNTTVHS